jgi:methyl-accepting chemotaxis protein
MNQLSVRTSLLGASALVFVVFMVALAVAVSGLNGAQQRLADYLAKDQVLLEAFSEMYAQGLQAGQAARNIILDPANPKAYENLDKARKDFNTALSQANALAGENAELADALKEITDLNGQREQRLSQITALARSDALAAQAKLNKEETPLWRKLKDMLLQHKQQVSQAAKLSADATLDDVGTHADLEHCVISAGSGLRRGHDVTDAAWACTADWGASQVMRWTWRIASLQAI